MTTNQGKTTVLVRLVGQELEQHLSRCGDVKVAARRLVLMPDQRNADLVRRQAMMAFEYAVAASWVTDARMGLRMIERADNFLTDACIAAALEENEGR